MADAQLSLDDFRANLKSLCLRYGIYDEERHEFENAVVDLMLKGLPVKVNNVGQLDINLRGFTLEALDSRGEVIKAGSTDVAVSNNFRTSLGALDLHIRKCKIEVDASKLEPVLVELSIIPNLPLPFFKNSEEH